MLITDSVCSSCAAVALQQPPFGQGTVHVCQNPRGSVCISHPRACLRKHALCCLLLHFLRQAGVHLHCT